MNAPELISKCKLMMVILRDFDSFSSLLRKLDYTITSYTITSHLLLHVGIKQVIYSSQKKKKKSRARENLPRKGRHRNTLIYGREIKFDNYDEPIKVSIYRA